ncbi:hypothetical protein AWB76_01450 [Caballeronia temeraria]|uniref:Uncharacterized protein n=1 Tax=Caballeronia temeraria TaxID=1777137 RepID=A0A157ZXV9_9BURK|nr:hypothetical protein [Caballeronia temeraria]SAK50330.1 hypothetical protein AWB76_01450 [Caballeronia temeraria]
MESGSVGYTYLGIPERLAGVLWLTVHDMQSSLSGREGCTWAQLTSASLSRCVLHFACLHRERGLKDPKPELTCSEVFHLFSEQLMADTTAAEWSVPDHLVPVVAGALAACGELVVDRMNRTC